MKLDNINFGYLHSVKESFITVRACAYALGVTEMTIRNWIRRKTLKYRMLDCVMMIKTDDIRKIIGGIK